MNVYLQINHNIKIKITIKFFLTKNNFLLIFILKIRILNYYYHILIIHPKKIIEFTIYHIHPQINDLKALYLH